MAETSGSQTSEFKLTAGGIVGSFAVGIATAGTGDLEIVIDGIPNPQKVKGILDRQLRQSRQSRRS